MLRNTGFFRGIDCPFYTEYGQGKDGRNGCNRPYCHFRHSHHRRPSYGAQADVKKQKDLQSAQNGREHFKYLVILRIIVLIVFIVVPMSSPALKLIVKANAAWSLAAKFVSKLIFFS